MDFRQRDSATGITDASLSTEDSSFPVSVVALSKSKILLQIVGFLIGVAIAYSLLLISPPTVRRLEYFFPILAYCGIAIFAVCGLYCLIRLFDFRPGLVVDEDGLVDNSSALAAGRIWWDDIVSLKMSSRRVWPYVTVVVADARNYVSRGNWVKRLMHWADPESSGEPICISLMSLDTSYSEMLRLLDSAKHQYEMTTLQAAREAILANDYDPLVILCDAQFGNLIEQLISDYDQAPDWTTRDAIIFVLQKTDDKRVKPIMEHALDSPTLRTRAIAIRQLESAFDLFHTFLVDWSNDPIRIDNAIANYRRSKR